MSVATEFAPDVFVPARARTCPPRERLATVTTLHRPSERSVAAPLRLTRRGVVVLSVAVAVLAAGLIGLARLSAPSSASVPPARAAVPEVVTVQAGDSLWSIAASVAPQTDPRAEVARLEQINHLVTDAVMPGQVLRTR